MPRWEPNGRQRLSRAALELFAEQGYENTTVAEITGRAGMASSTFFRHFGDKREVLFIGQDILARLLADGVAAAPAGATPLEAVAAALDAATAGFPADLQDLAPQRAAVIAATPPLQERETLKNAGCVAVIAAALRERGVADPVAGIAAELGMLAYKAAQARWAAPGNQQSLRELARAALKDVQAATREIR
jgi:AcrR family transcriptional regulator